MMEEFRVSDYQNRIMGVVKTDQLKMCVWMVLTIGRKDRGAE
jgi:hypothetical protein